MPLITVPVFALTFWAGCYLAGREPGPDAALRAPWRAATAMVTYALGVAAWTVAPESTVAATLFAATALLWAGAALALLPASVPERRPIDVGWQIVSPLLLAVSVPLPQAGKLIVLAPLIASLVLLGRFRDQVRPPMLPTALAVAATLYAAGLALLLLLPVAAGPTLAALGLDVLMLGFLVAVAEALHVGERLRPDLVRGVTVAVTGALLAGGPAALTIVAANGDPAVTIIQFVLVAGVMAAIGLGRTIRRLLDGVTFMHDERLRQERSELFALADALPRHRQRHRLITTSEADFERFVAQALDNYQHLDRLARSTLTDLPAVDHRMTGRAIEQPLARAVELRTVLREGVERLRPAGPFATTDEWRYYHALYYCRVLGLDPHRRRQRTEGLDREARQALEWMRRFAPQRVLRRWQREGAAILAARMREELVGTDPRWLTRVPAGKRHAST